MKSIYLKKSALLAALLLAVSVFSEAQVKVGSRQSRSKSDQSTAKASSRIEQRNVRAHMEFLAGDALNGRGSGTQFELLAGQYIASLLQ